MTASTAIIFQGVNEFFLFRARPDGKTTKELSEKAEKRKKKKSYYAKLKREEDDKANLILQKTERTVFLKYFLYVLDGRARCQIP
jgi:hypothetical protein